MSVVEVGCALGYWLSVFKDAGIVDYMGVDGDWIDKSMLTIPADKFVVSNFCEKFYVGRQYDLVLSLEVAEHLPVASAVVFVESLISHGPVVVFSAAIPRQGGNGHQNEQWPEYWKDIFEERGYVCVDFIRRDIWNNEKILWWYKQNMLMFIRRESLDGYHLDTYAQPITDNHGMLSVVHPENYLGKCESLSRLSDLANISLGTFLFSFPKILKSFILRRLKA